MRNRFLKFFAFILVICLTLPMLSVFSASSVVALSLSYSGDAFYGGVIKVKIAVAKPTKALAGLEFTLSYDPDHVTPVITENTPNETQMDAFFVSKPANWEQMNYHSSSDAEYQLRFVMPDSGTSLLDTANELVLEIPFTVKAAGSFDFTVSNEDIIAIVADNSFTPMGGTGGRLNVVAASEAQKMAIDITSDETVTEGGIYYVDIDVTNLGDANGIIAYEFDLTYNKSAFSPIYTSNGTGQMDIFIVAAPQNAWEQMCSLDTANGKYTLRFAATHAESNTTAEKLVSGAKMKISVPFRVIGSEGNISEFSIASSSIIGINGANSIITGSGDTKSISIEKAASISIPPELGYTFANGCLMYVPEKTNVSTFLAPLGSLYLKTASGARVTSGYVKTGHILTDGGSFSLTVVVKGDADGSGTVTSNDYIWAKRVYLGTIKPTTNVQLYAVAFGNKTRPTLIDLIKIKRHCMGTYKL